MAHGRRRFQRRRFCYLLVGAGSGHLVVGVLLFSLYYFFAQSVYPVFWAIPAKFLSETTAAAAFGVIGSVGGLSSFLGPSIVGYLNDLTTLFAGACRLSVVASWRLRSSSPSSGLRPPMSSKRLSPS